MKKILFILISLLLGITEVFPQSGNVGSEGTRLAKGWFVDIAITNLPSTIMPTNDTAAMLSKYARLYSPSFTGVPLAPTAVVGTNTTQLATTAFVFANTNTDILAYKAMGSAIKAIVTGLSLSNIVADITMTDSRAYYVAIYLPTPQTITGVKMIQHTQGDYTADNYNGVALYSVSAGTLTLRASSTNDGTIWKAVAGATITKAFSAQYSAVAGLYFVVAVWNTSDSPPATVPHIKSGGTIAYTTSFDFTNSLFITGYKASTTALATPTIESNTITVTTVVPFMALY